MKRWTLALLITVLIVAVFYAAIIVRRGFSAADQPSYLERVLARAARNIGIPRPARTENNPLQAAPEILAEARENFANR